MNGLQFTALSLLFELKVISLSFVYNVYFVKISKVMFVCYLAERKASQGGTGWVPRRGRSLQSLQSCYESNIVSRRVAGCQCPLRHSCPAGRDTRVDIIRPCRIDWDASRQQSERPSGSTSHRSRPLHTYTLPVPTTESPAPPPQTTDDMFCSTKKTNFTTKWPTSWVMQMQNAFSFRGLRSWPPDQGLCHLDPTAGSVLPDPLYRFALRSPSGGQTLDLSIS